MVKEKGVKDGRKLPLNEGIKNEPCSSVAKTLWDPMNELTSPNCGESYVNNDKTVYKVL